ESREALHRDVLTEFADSGRDELADGDGLLLDEGLLKQAHFLVELGHLAFDDLLDHRSGLARGGSLRAIDVLLFFKGFRSHVLFTDELRIAGSDVHRDVVRQLLELRSARDEIALAIHFHEDADLAARVDVAHYRAFAGGAARLLCCRCHALLAQYDDGVFHVALGFGKGVLAIHHRGAGLLTKLFYLCCTDIHGGCAHFLIPIWTF